MLHVPNNSTGAVAREVTERMLITPTVARKWVNFHSFWNQRPIALRHVRALYDAFLAGEFNTHQAITLAYDLRTGNWCVVNGHHRLKMIELLGIPVEMTVQRLFFNGEYVAKTEAVYATYDIGGKTRTTGDILWSHMDVRTTGLSADMATKVAKAARHAILGFPATASGADHKNRSVELQHKALLDYMPEAREYLGYIAAAGTRSMLGKALRTTPIMSLFLQVCRESSNIAVKTAFFTGMAADSMLASGDPRKAFNDLVKMRWMRAVKSGAQKPYSGPQQTKIATRTWNAFVTNKPLLSYKIDADEAAPAAKTPPVQSPSSLITVNIGTINFN